jgi:hypothetical protein
MIERLEKLHNGELDLDQIQKLGDDIWKLINFAEDIGKRDSKAYYYWAMYIDLFIEDTTKKHDLNL